MKGLLIEVWTKLRETKRPMARSLYTRPENSKAWSCGGNPARAVAGF